MKKKTLVRIAEISTLILGFGTVINLNHTFNPTTVYAKAEEFQYYKLVHNAAIYNKNGIKTSNKILKKGTVVKVFVHYAKDGTLIYNTHYIKHRKFTYIGNGQYIKDHNLSPRPKNVRKNIRALAKKYWDIMKKFDPDQDEYIATKKTPILNTDKKGKFHPYKWVARGEVVEVNGSKDFDSFLWTYGDKINVSKGKIKVRTLISYGKPSYYYYLYDSATDRDYFVNAADVKLTINPDYHPDDDDE